MQHNSKAAVAAHQAPHWHRRLVYRASHKVCVHQAFKQEMFFFEYPVTFYVTHKIRRPGWSDHSLVAMKLHQFLMELTI